MSDSITFPKINHDHPISPPISKLDGNTLWYIFYLNADMECLTTGKIVHGLHTLRHTSQVCRDWRTLVVGSSSLWARVLDFSFLPKKRNDWRKEVIRRTGTAPLHIKFHNNNTAPWSIDDFFQDLLEENWNRIHNLDVSFGHGYRDVVPGRWASLFHSPAPSLRSFKFKWRAQREEFYSPSFSLFKNTATSLREFSVLNMNLDLTALSTPNLRRLELNEPVAASNLLRALEHMPLLEALILDSSRGGPIVTGEITSSSFFYSRVSLPCLTEINFAERDGADGSLSLLLHIRPASGCVLFYSCRSCLSRTEINIELYCGVFSTYLRYCPELSSATVLDVRIDEDRFIFKIPLPHKRCFAFEIDDFAGGLPQHIVPSLLWSLTTLQLNKITKLKLPIAFGRSLSLDAEILKFIFKFTSVEDWTTNISSLECLTTIQSQNRNTLAFPSLKVINLDLPVHWGDEESSIVAFLDGRVRLGKPAKTFTLTRGGSLLRVNIEPHPKFYPYLDLQLKGFQRGSKGKGVTESEGEAKI
ncbi:hypothetical protein GALMADRAFT_258403 [Galerina marginata CBS 339.88]|uniref:F-box domain-containing protein n=1 Tax=Galerina marginata (strain CBS 339.88) TaxID=685588 RepID=A0A067SIE3_GALM3|nr:hypothetical protein GALMADRAFT_258403 [Galerina marginata CBS 339.88]